MIDRDANLASALYFLGVWDVPETMGDDEFRLIPAGDVDSCETRPERCDWMYDPAEPEVGLEAHTYCQVHSA